MGGVTTIVDPDACGGKATNPGVKALRNVRLPN